MQTLVERLRMDFGKKTLGELIQDREAAALEIERLTQELAKSRAASVPQPKPQHVKTTFPQQVMRIGADGREFLRLVDVCKIVGLSRSTIYYTMASGDFPRAVRVGARAVRWRASEVAGWMASKRP
jgi:prophage regulatory protein